MIPDIEKFLPVAIFKMATTIPHKFNTVRYQKVAFNLFFKPVVSGRIGRLHNRQIIFISCFYYYYSYSLSPFFPWTMNLSMADLRNYWTEFHETWWSYRYMFLVDPKVFRFVVNRVKATLLGVQPWWGLLQNPMGNLKFRTLMLITSNWIMIET